MQNKGHLEKPPFLSTAILLGTHNGQAFLEQQLDSFGMQTDTHWQVWASDDASSDHTLALLKAYQQQWATNQLHILSGPAQGFVANFLSLVCRTEIHADYYAYADQDDIWEKDKLERALAWLNTVPSHTPALYCTRTRFIDEHNQELGLSSRIPHPPAFANALLHNIGGGNTMVFNEAARALLCLAGPEVNVIAHDWWTYIVVSGCKGVVHFDPYPSVRYRQHAHNLIGSNIGIVARYTRMRKVWQNHFKQWADMHLSALERLHSQLSADSLRTLQHFTQMREQWLIPRLISLKRSGVYHQRPLGTLGLWLAAVFNKI